MEKLDGRVALVTGGSRGIGAATATAFAAAGARVVVLYAGDRDVAETTVAGLPGVGHRAVQADVSDSAAVAAAAESVRATEGALHFLVNNAGWTTVIPHGQLYDLTDEIFEHVFQVNTFGVFRVTRALAPLMRESVERDGVLGCVVNISSNAAVSGMGSNIAYCASKAAVDSLTKTLARVLAPNIRVIGIAPGLTLTDMAAKFGEEEKQRRAQLMAVKRLAQPSEIASAVLAAASSLTFSTGTTVLCDGGRHLA